MSDELDRVLLHERYGYPTWWAHPGHQWPLDTDDDLRLRQVLLDAPDGRNNFHDDPEEGDRCLGSK